MATQTYGFVDGAIQKRDSKGYGHYAPSTIPDMYALDLKILKVAEADMVSLYGKDWRDIKS